MFTNPTLTDLTHILTYAGLTISPCPSPTRANLTAWITPVTGIALYFGTTPPEHLRHQLDAVHLLYTPTAPTPETYDQRQARIGQATPAHAGDWMTPEDVRATLVRLSMDLYVTPENFHLDHPLPGTGPNAWEYTQTARYATDQAFQDTITRKAA